MDKTKHSISPDIAVRGNAFDIHSARVLAKKSQAESDEMWEKLGDKHVRLLRAVVYEGSASWLRKQLAGSMDPGHKALGLNSITVYQDVIEIVEG